MSTQDPPPNDNPDDGPGEEVVDLGSRIEIRDGSFVVKDVPLPRVRWWLALALLTVVAVVIMGCGVLIGLDALTPEEARDLLAVILAPLFTLLGTVVAFYFKETSNGA